MLSLVAPGTGMMADPERSGSAKVVFLITKLIAPREAKMCTPVPLFSGLTDPHKVQLEINKNNGTHAEDQAWLRT